MDAMQQKQDNGAAEWAQDSFLPSLEIGLKAERVQEPQSLVAKAEPVGALVCQLSVQPVQPVSITLSDTAVVFTLHGPGSGTSPGEAS